MIVTRTTILISCENKQTERLEAARWTTEVALISASTVTTRLDHHHGQFNWNTTRFFVSYNHYILYFEQRTIQLKVADSIETEAKPLFLQIHFFLNGKIKANMKNDWRCSLLKITSWSIQSAIISIFMDCAWLWIIINDAGVLFVPRGLCPRTGLEELWRCRWVRCRWFSSSI